MIYDAAVVIPTVLRKSVLRAVRSVYAQELQGTVQVMLGVDVVRGSREFLDELRAECPANMALSVVDLGYSTARRNGGLYPTYGGGALRTVMSYAANSRYLAYLDDDNWWAPTHLADLLRAVQGKDWAFSLRWYVDPATQEPIGVDEWESVGPGRGVYKTRFNGFVDPNCLMIDKQACHWVLPAWCIPLLKNGEGEDRYIFKKLQENFRWASTGRPTSYYVFRPDDRTIIQGFLDKKREAQQRAGAEAGTPAGNA